MSDPTDVREILTDEALANLRAGYDRESFYAAVKQTLDAPYAGAERWTTFIMEDLYAPEPLSHGERELVVIALLAAQGEVGPLAVHFYWGLMEGLSPAKLAHGLMLAGTYGGANRYVNASRLLQRVLNMLQSQGAAGKDAAALPTVVGKLLEIWPS